MKKEIKKKFDPGSVPLPAIRVEVSSEPLSLHFNPQDIRPELECVLETSRQMLTALGEHRETIIIYTADKSLLLLPEVRNHRDMMTVRVMIEHFVEEYSGRAVILAFEAAINRIDNTLKEDPNPKHALIVEAKNLNEHLLAVQIFDEENGRFSFKPVEIMHLDEKSSVDGNWLSDLEFEDSFFSIEPVGNC